jgi:hypothetical protein
MVCFASQKKVCRFQISPLFLFNPARQEVVEVQPPCMEDDGAAAHAGENM